MLVASQSFHLLVTLTFTPTTTSLEQLPVLNLILTNGFWMPNLTPKSTPNWTQYQKFRTQQRTVMKSPKYHWFSSLSYLGGRMTLKLPTMYGRWHVKLHIRGRYSGNSRGRSTETLLPNPSLFQLFSIAKAVAIMIAINPTTSITLSLWLFQICVLWSISPSNESQQLITKLYEDLRRHIFNVMST